MKTIQVLLFALAATAIQFSSASVCVAEFGIPKNQIPSHIPPEVKQQIERLYSPDGTDRASAAFYLMKMGDKALPSVPFLIANLHDNWTGCGTINCGHNHVTPADEAERTIISMGKGAVPALIKASADENLEVRKRVTRILGEIKDPRAVQCLLLALDDKDRNVRMLAADSLGQIGKPSTEGLLGVLKNKEKPIETRADAAWALGKIGDPSAVEPLIVVLDEGDADVRLQASRALGRITSKDFGESSAEWQKWWAENRAK
jgi:HEAT repeat protein